MGIERHIKYIHGPNNSIESIYEIAPGRWIDKDGAEYALEDKKFSVDDSDRCGVGLFALPANAPIMCSPHDYAYSSPAYQAFHTRKEADDYLESLIEQAPGAWAWLAKPFHFIVRWFGGGFWENKETNN